jgi:hypothetical protein
MRGVQEKRPLKKTWGAVKKNRFKVIVVLSVMVLLGFTAVVQASLDSSAKSEPGWDKSSPFDTGRSLVDVLGGLRSSLAAYFWTRSDNIFHEFFPHGLGQDKPLYPYYWMVTRLDPHFAMPYYYASWMLCQFGHKEEGLKLAREGVRYNPDSALLQENLASIYFYYFRDPEKAKYHSEKAIELGTADEKDMFKVFDNLIGQVLAGKKKILKMIPLEQINRLHQEPPGEQQKD